MPSWKTRINVSRKGEECAFSNTFGGPSKRLMRIGNWN